MQYAGRVVGGGLYIVNSSSSASSILAKARVRANVQYKVLAFQFNLIQVNTDCCHLATLLAGGMPFFWWPLPSVVLAETGTIALRGWF